MLALDKKKKKKKKNKTDVYMVCLMMK
jgi:hypothetical protein